MSRTRMILPLTLIALLTACARAPAQDPTPQGIDEVHPMSYSLTIGGAVSVRYEVASLDVHIKKIEDARVGQRLLLLQPAKPIDVEGARMVWPGVLVMRFEGDGRYTVGAGKQAVPTLGTAQTDPVPDLSRSWVEVQAGKSFRRYQEGSCAVEVRDGGFAGSVTCPALRRAEAVSEPPVSLRFSWSKRGGGS